jgi:hypothetical protein
MQKKRKKPQYARKNGSQAISKNLPFEVSKYMGGYTD